MFRSALDEVPGTGAALLGPATTAGPAALAVAVLALAAIAVVLEAVRRRRHGR